MITEEYWNLINYHGLGLKGTFVIMIINMRNLIFIIRIRIREEVWVISSMELIIMVVMKMEKETEVEIKKM